MRISGGGTDFFNGFEYFGLITLASRGLRVHSMRFFWRACGVCAFYGFVSVAWSCDPTFIAYPHGLPIVRYPCWFFRHVWYLVLCFSVAFALIVPTVPAQVLVVALRSVAEVAAFSPNPRVLALVLGFSGLA